MDHRYLGPYLISILIGISAIPLGLLDRPLFAGVALVLATASLFTTRRLAENVRQAEGEKLMLKRELVRCQTLARMDELSAGIAHEINNPLAIISQETQWMKHVLAGDAFQHIEGTSDCRESLAAISLQIERCTEIVAELRNLASEIQPVGQQVDVNELTNQMTGLIDREATGRNIQIERFFQSDVPLIFTDPPLLRQVILNILANAVQAIEGDGRIRVTTTTGAKWVDVSIQDTGCGIPPENLKKIFTPFFSTKLGGKGSGMGLAICRGIIEQLGGSISVESQVGRGTTFTIRLPLDMRNTNALSDG